jgi:hypothetical protein
VMLLMMVNKDGFDVDIRVLSFYLLVYVPVSDPSVVGIRLRMQGFKRCARDR